MTDLISMLNATGHWWMIGRGRTTREEKLFGCLIQEAREGGRVLATTEGDDLADCVVCAIAEAGRPRAAAGSAGEIHEREARPAPRSGVAPGNPS